MLLWADGKLLYSIVKRFCYYLFNHAIHVVWKSSSCSMHCDLINILPSPSIILFYQFYFYLSTNSISFINLDDCTIRKMTIRHFLALFLIDLKLSISYIDTIFSSDVVRWVHLILFYSCPRKWTILFQFFTLQ